MSQPLTKRSLLLLHRPLSSRLDLTLDAYRVLETYGREIPEV